MNFRSLHYVWQAVPCLNSALQPTRVSFILAVAMPVLFLLVPQGNDVLGALGERDSLDLRIVWFLVSLVLFGLMNWFGPRFLLDCDFGQDDHQQETRRRFEGDPAALARYQKIEGWLGVHLPRLLGTVPIALIGAGFFNLWRNHLKYGAGTVTIHGQLAILCSLLALLLYLFFVGRRFLLTRLRVKRGTVAPTRYHNVSDIARDRLALFGFAIFLLPAVVLGFLFTLAPIPVGLYLGSGAVLCFALASWACYGGIAVYIGHRARLPTLLIGVLVLIAASFFNDNHAVRTLDQMGPPKQRATLSTRLQGWHDHVAANYSGRHPLFIVVTEGGGIRAAYWTALVLSTLEQHAPGRFADHVFAISGVSGGSLGAATFEVMLKEPSAEPPAVRVHRQLGEAFLAPLVGKMAFPDLWQRFLPWRLAAFDRAQALEDGWARTMPAFDEPFSSFCDTSTWTRPELFFNGTEVESGRRIVTGTVRFDENDTEFVNAIDGVVRMEGQDMRLSTAVHSSARFTYFSPAGRYPNGTHVVDGGYYENSGGSTGSDILRAVRRQGWTDVDPMVIVITNGPEAIRAEIAAGVTRRDNHAGHEMFAPLTAMLGTRTAHADHAVGDLRASVTEKNVFTFGLVEHGTALPLGWALSPGAMDEMEFQIDASAQAAKLASCDPDTRDALLRNTGALARVVARLPGQP